MTLPKLITEKKMARRLGVQLDWLRAEADAGRLPHVKTSDGYLFDPELVERLLLERAQQVPGAEVGHE